VDFAVNRQSDDNANQVIAWTFTVAGTVGGTVGGDETLDRFSTDAAITWRYGRPVRVGFRWAHNAPTAPLTDPQQPALQVLPDNSAVYAHDGPWSLIAMLTGQRNRADERQPHLLTFQVPIRTLSASTTFSGAPDYARLSIRVGLAPVPADGSDAPPARSLTLPAFPTAAPPLR
jgi:hypothetical protein